MERGWVKIYRKIQDNPLWNEKPFSRGQAWIDLLLLANHKDNYIIARGIKVDIKRGQVGWSEVKLSARWGWSRSKLRTFLKLLESEQQIKQQKNNVSLLITIENYHNHQEKGQQNVQQKDSKGTTEGQQKDTNKNEKKDKNEKKLVGFNEFYKAYPKKKSKGQAEKTWNKLSPTNDLLKEILTGLEIAKKSEDWIKDNGKYIPHPSTWLNAKGWEDSEVEMLGDDWATPEDIAAEEARIKRFEESKRGI